MGVSSQETDGVPVPPPRVKTHSRSNSLDASLALDCSIGMNALAPSNAFTTVILSLLLPCLLYVFCEKLLCVLWLSLCTIAELRL